MSSSDLTPIVVEGRNCWRVERADKARMIVDAADYYALLEGLMRIQDKVRGHKIARKANGEAQPFGQLGHKMDDELPIPHHSGYVAAPADQEPLYDHQKLTG